MVNWGKFAGTTSAINIMFTVSYNIVPIVIATNIHSSTTQAPANVSTISFTDFKIHVRSANAYVSDSSNWVAIGY